MSVRYRVAVVIVACLISSFTVFAKVQPDGSIAPIEISRTSIHWRLQVPSSGVTITVVRPDGEIVRKDFRTPNPSLAPSDLGDPLEDGIYTYELIVTPVVPTHVQQRLQQARKNNDDAAVRKTLRDAHLDRAMNESGTFSVAGGSFVLPETNEHATNSQSSAATATAHQGSTATSGGRSLRPTLTDQVIPDELIVQSSICAGFDCVDGESFGVDTLRLKENNLRIHFEDTSTSAGYAANDWRIVANDQPSGGANKFSIDDVTGGKTPFTMRAAAPSNSIYVDGNGKLGLKTAAPGLDIHVTSNDTPAWRMEQTSAGGFTAQTWDIGANEANFFVRDLTSGSRLPFRIRPGAPTSSVDISANGNVGIGTASPADKLHVTGTVRSSGGASTFGAITAIADTTAYSAFLTLGSARPDVYFGQAAANWSALLNAGTEAQGLLVGTYTNRPIVFGTNNIERLRIDSVGNIGIGVGAPTNPLQHSSGAVLTPGGVWQNASSRVLKQDISRIEGDEARAAVMALDPVQFRYKVDPAERHTGFIAEDVPALVASTDRKSLSAMDIVAVLAKVVQDQQRTIEELSIRIKNLEAEPK